MNTKLILAGAALSLCVGGVASAHGKSSSMNYAAPSEPIPYSQLDAYLSASPQQRMAMNNSSNPSMGATTPAATTPAPGDTAVNPMPASPTPGADSTTATPTSTTPPAAATPTPR